MFIYTLFGGLNSCPNLTEMYDILAKFLKDDPLMCVEVMNLVSKDPPSNLNSKRVCYGISLLLSSYG